jgi:hypothetical protein
MCPGFFPVTRETGTFPPITRSVIAIFMMKGFDSEYNIIN